MAYDPIDDLREEIDQQVFDIHLASTERRRVLDAQILPPTAPKIESNFSAHPNVPFHRKPETRQTPGMLARPKPTDVYNFGSGAISPCVVGAIQDVPVTDDGTTLQDIFLSIDPNGDLSATATLTVSWSDGISAPTVILSGLLADFAGHDYLCNQAVPNGGYIRLEITAITGSPPPLTAIWSLDGIMETGPRKIQFIEFD